VFLLMVPSHILAGATDTHTAQTIFNWIVPIVLVVFAHKRTSHLSEGARDEDTVAAA
jgi:hypothetical protein